MRERAHLLSLGRQTLDLVQHLKLQLERAEHEQAPARPADVRRPHGTPAAESVRA